MSISTISFNNASRTQIMRIQTELRDALLETSSSRHADVGRTLGRSTGIAVSYRSQETSLDRLLQSNTLVAQRLTLAYDALEPVADAAENMAGALVAGLGTDAFLASAGQIGRGALDQLTGALNLSVGGQYLFSGTQTDVRPMKGWTEGPEAAVRDHFAQFRQAAGTPLKAADVTAYFGAGFVTDQPQLDAGGQPVLDTDGNAVMQRIAFDDIFRKDAGSATGPWNDTFSQASDQAIRSRISNTEEIASSVSANEKAFRDLMAGYAAVELASADMNAATRGAVAEAARTRITSGLAGVTALRADLGNRQARLESADVAIKQQKDIFAAHLSSLEEVDYVEASERVSALRTQLEASMRVTGMIREINILDYL